MSSYNNIRKIKYTKNPSDVVSLQEYIIFEDSHASEKYVVFKFSNNLNQRLLGFKFEVLQYNLDNELLEKSTVLYENFIAEANDLFVPNAKLKINFKCESLEVKLKSASFDRVVWGDGEFRDNSYRFDNYAETVIKPAQSARTKDDNRRKESKKDIKKIKAGFKIRDISRRNKAVFPTVFNVFLCAVIIGLVIFSTFYFKNVTHAFAIDSFVVKESSMGYVTILDYTGQDEEIVIPSTLELEETSYSVTKIAKGAFKKSKIKSVEFDTTKSLVIETGAFFGCSYLTKVNSSQYCGSVTLMEGAFTDCQALTSFLIPTAVLCEKCFYGTDNIDSLSFNKLEDQNNRLLDIFNGLDSITLKFFQMSSTNVNPSFLEGVIIR